MIRPTGGDEPKLVSAINRAIDMANGGRFSEAVHALENLVEEFPQAPAVRGYLAWFLLQLGNADKSIAQSREAIKLAPASERVSLIHFHALWKSGRHIDALDEMRRFLMVRPSDEYSKIIRDWEP